MTLKFLKEPGKEVWRDKSSPSTFIRLDKNDVIIVLEVIKEFNCIKVFSKHGTGYMYSYKMLFEELGNF